MKLTTLGSTFFKVRPVQSTQLSDLEKTAIAANTTLALSAYSEEAGHFNIQLATPLQGRDRWYVYAPHVRIEDKAAPPAFKLKVMDSTLLKARPLQSSELGAAEKAPLRGGLELDLVAYNENEMNHYQVTLAEAIQGREQWYVYVPHVRVLGGDGKPVIAPRAAMSIPSDAGWAWPMKGTSCGPKCEFGFDRGRLHAGVDIGGFTPDECYAASDGVVKTVKNDTSGAEGRAIYIQRADGWQHVYFHMRSIAVQPGQAVKRGQLIGIRGGSGFGGEGREIDGGGYSIHLHFEIRKPDGTPVDPRTILPNDNSCPRVR
jgi:lipoprotein NlpD